MNGFRYSRAAAAIEALSPGELSMRVARHWLSLWQDDAPPSRDDFQPAAAREFLPGLALMECHSNGEVTCRLSGSSLDRALGFTLAGRNMLDLVPKEARALRQLRSSDVALGRAIGRSLTVQADAGQPLAISELMYLPFSGTSVTGSHLYFVHSTIRFSFVERPDQRLPQLAGMPQEWASEALA